MATANEKWKQRLRAYEFILVMKEVEEKHGFSFDSCECCGGIYISAPAELCFQHTITDVQDMEIDYVKEQIALCKQYIDD